MGTERFDGKAATWDQDPTKVKRAAQVAAAITRTLDLAGTERLLEYGAGTGLVSQGLVGSVGPITLADNSTGMRQAMVAKLDAGDLPADARIWDLDLEAQAPPDGEFFDLIVTVMVLHHVHDLPRVITAFASMLAPGGRLVIVDLDAEDGSFHGHESDVHHGFDRDELSGALASAGLVDVRMEDCTTIVRDDHTFSTFLTTAAALPPR